MAVWSESTLIEAYLSRRIDSEFFRPAYVHAEQQTRKCNAENLGRLGRLIPGPFGSAFHVKNYDFQSPYRYLRGRDIKPFFILDDDNRYVPETDFHRLQDYAVQHDDLMVSVVGTLGNVAVCTSYETPAIFSCKSTLFRTIDVNPYYLLAYLNCHQGQLCLLRRQRGTVQTGLNIEDLKNIPIPRFDNKVESEIASSVQLAYKALRDSKEHCTQAQHLLESELGLDKLSFQKPVGYTARFSELQQSRRMDADYFQVSFRKIQNHLNKLETVSLYQLAEIVKGIEVGSQAYTQTGIPFLRVSNVKELGVDLGASDKYISEKLYRNLISYHPQVGELLLTKDGTPGICYALDQEIDGIISGGIVRLIFRDTGIPKEYIALAINSKACRMQIEHDCSGALIVHWKPSSIRKLRIPLISTERMLKIDELVTKSKQAMRDSARLLDQSKTRVEHLIEEAVRR